MEQRQYTGRKVKGNHSNASPRYIIAYDSETIPVPADASGKRFSHNFRLGVVKYTRLRGGEFDETRTVRIESEQGFWELCTYLSGPRHTVWIVAHNIIFDMVVTGISERFLDGRLVFDWPRSKRRKNKDRTDNKCDDGSIVIESPPTIIAVKDTASNGRMVFVDTLNWFKGSLRKLGESLGLPKHEMPSFAADDETWFNYCERDCEIVLRTFCGLIQWVKSNDMGMFRYTAPAQAMAAYRHRFMGQQIFVHDNVEVKRLERAAYYGGRTECWRLGELDQTVSQLDVNSLFPSVMQSGEFPYKLDRYEIREEYLEILPSIDARRSVAEVVLETDQAIYPVRQIGRVVYPIGRFTTTLCGEELQSAWAAGSVRSVRRWAEYATAPIFKLWVNTLWQMRQGYRITGNGLYADFCKNLMNSLYGKFAQLQSEWVSDENAIAGLPWSQWSSINPLTGTRDEYRSFGWNVQRRMPKKQVSVRTSRRDGVDVQELFEEFRELKTTFVAISAFITAAARQRMNYLRNICNPRDVYYQGVDSLIVTNAGLAALMYADAVRNEELGFLRFERAHHTGWIYGCADYTIGDKVVVSGLSVTNEIVEDGQLMQRKFSGVKSLFQQGIDPTITESIVPWKRAAEYRKGYRQADGWVTPLVLAGGKGSCVDESASAW